MEWKMVIVTRVKCASEAQSYKLFCITFSCFRLFLIPRFEKPVSAVYLFLPKILRRVTRKFPPSPGYGAGGIVKDLNSGAHTKCILVVAVAA